ncbi:outer membrane beta-barrel protein [Myroides odoratus]|uniref:outer membrane beta-barrel protein n=1 Tax=Myroides odoratus TaxID=256 RepID=UPI0039B0117A
MLKKLLLVTSLILGVTTGSYAQKKFTPGVRGGLSLSTLTNAEADYKAGFYIGIQFPIHIAKFYTLQPEINYTRQGANKVNLDAYYNYTWNTSPGQFSQTEDINLGYIDINVINKFRFNKFNLHAGPGLAIMTEGSSKTDFYGDLTLNLGVGYKITEQLEVEARWRQGFVRVIDKDYWGNNYWGGYGDETFNSSFQIGLNFTF